MKTFRIFLFLSFLQFIVPLASAQFTLNVFPVAGGSAQLEFTRDVGYYVSLEEASDLKGTFTAASGWMLGDDLLVSWPIHFSVSSTSGNSGGTTATLDTFSLYPFGNGKTLVTWSDSGGVRYSALVVQDYSTLPPLMVIPGSANNGSLMLLVGALAWESRLPIARPGSSPAGTTDRAGTSH